MKDLKDFLKVAKTDSEIFKKQYELTESDEEIDKLETDFVGVDEYYNALYEHFIKTKLC